MIKQDRIPDGMQSLVVPRADGRRDVLGVELVNVPGMGVVRALWDPVEGVLYTSVQVPDRDAILIVVLLSPEHVTDEALHRLGLARPVPPVPPEPPLPPWDGHSIKEVRRLLGIDPEDLPVEGKTT